VKPHFMDGVLLTKYYLLATCCIISFLLAEVEVFKQFWAEYQCVMRTINCVVHYIVTVQ